MLHTIQSFIYEVSEWIKLIVECTGVIIIAWGVLVSLWLYAGKIFTTRGQKFIPLRTSLAGYLILALEFQLAADIISTAIAPGWNEIGQLGAIAVIRTVLNYFLEQEVKTLEIDPE